jgi:hypothetical protein
MDNVAQSVSAAPFKNSRDSEIDFNDLGEMERPALLQTSDLPPHSESTAVKTVVDHLAVMASFIPIDGCC